MVLFALLHLSEVVHCVAWLMMAEFIRSYHNGVTFIFQSRGHKESLDLAQKMSCNIKVFYRIRFQKTLCFSRGLLTRHYVNASLILRFVRAIIAACHCPGTAYLSHTTHKHKRYTSRYSCVSDCTSYNPSRHTRHVHSSTLQHTGGRPIVTPTCARDGRGNGWWGSRCGVCGQGAPEEWWCVYRRRD